MRCGMRTLNTSYREDFLDSADSVDEIIAAVVAGFPRTQIMADDWYAERRKVEEAIVAEARSLGRPMSNLALDALDRTAREKGPTKAIEISLDGAVVLTGRISDRLTLLRCDSPIEAATIARLREVFRSLGILNESGVSLADARWERQPSRRQLDGTEKWEDEHTRLYWAAGKAIRPYLKGERRLHPPKKVMTEVDARVLTKGIDDLKSSIALQPNDSRNWSSLWLIGKAYEALNNFETAHHFFAQAYSTFPRNVEASREFTASCLRTNRIDEAVRVARSARDLAPKNPDVLANLAKALLAAGTLEEARIVANAAVEIAPDDRRIGAIVEDITKAQRERGQSSD
jgi:tetratricopeptide (TPR) repeat protein